MGEGVRLWSHFHGHYRTVHEDTDATWTARPFVSFKYSSMCPSSMSLMAIIVTKAVWRSKEIGIGITRGEALTDDVLHPLPMSIDYV